MTETVHGYCRFCVALCGIRVTVDNDQVVDVRGDDVVGLLRGIGEITWDLFHVEHRIAP